MRLLLDTHVLLWAILEPHKLSKRVHSWIQDHTNELQVSSATAWEIATKFRLGKLSEAGEVATNYLEATRKFGVQHLDIAPRHALAAGAFEVEHRDPFDRMLAAQSLLEGFSLVSADPCFRMFPIRVLW